MNLPEVVQGQIKFAVADVVACICNCHYDTICRESQSTDST